MEINSWYKLNTLICRELNWEEGVIEENNKLIKVYTPFKFVEYKLAWLENQTHWLLGHAIPQFAFSYEDMNLLLTESSKLYNVMYEMKIDGDGAWCKILKRPNYIIEATLSNRGDNDLPICLPLIVSLTFLKYRGIELEGSLIHSGKKVELENIIYY